MCDKIDNIFCALSTGGIGKVQALFSVVIVICHLSRYHSGWIGDLQVLRLLLMSVWIPFGVQYS